MRVVRRMYSARRIRNVWEMREREMGYRGAIVQERRRMKAVLVISVMNIRDWSGLNERVRCMSSIMM
jgi:hypothetical protein